MRFASALLALALLPAIYSLRVGAADDDEGMTGDWTGELDVVVDQFTVLFRVKEFPNGNITATVTVPEKSQQAAPVKVFHRKGREVNVDMPIIGARFNGKLNAKGDRIRGEWTSEGYTVDLDLERIEGGFAQDRPQMPKEPFPYDVEEVTFNNRFSNKNLAGTLTLPRNRPGAGAPAVVLVSDAGPHDRDATASNHRPFAVLADYLTRRGIAVLRYDDRGVGKSSGDYEFGTTRDFATDAWAAVDFLSKRKDIHPGNIGVIGHGEGAWAATIAEEQRDDISFLVMLAAPGLRGDKTLVVRNEALARGAGASEATRNLLTEFSTSVYGLLAGDPAAAAAEAQRLGANLEKSLAALPKEDVAKLAEVGQIIGDELKGLESPWLARFVVHDPAAGIQGLRCAVLALNGANDLEVPADVHLPAIEAQLKKRGTDDHEVRKLPGLNHRFQKADNGSPSLYGTFDETFATSAMKIIAEWIEKQVD